MKPRPHGALFHRSCQNAERVTRRSNSSALPYSAMIATSATASAFCGPGWQKCEQSPGANRSGCARPAERSGSFGTTATRPASASSAAATSGGGAAHAAHARVRDASRNASGVYGRGT